MIQGEDKMKRIIKSVLLIFVMFLVVSSNDFLSNAKTLEYSIDDYQEAINRYNEEHNTTYEISNTQLFYRNVYNIFSPDELIKTFDAEQYYTEKMVENNGFMRRAEPTQSVRYDKVILVGGHLVKVYARIVTRFPNQKKAYFVRYDGCGQVAYESGYYFNIYVAECTRLTSTECVVKMSGTCINSVTGISDATYYTVNVLFTP